MSKSLKLLHGDLSIGGRSLDTVSGQDKLVQDLSLWIRERIGTDPMTPNFGSTLDGGTVNGQEVVPFIGQTLNPIIQGQIATEIYNQLTTYQTMQLEKIKSESVLYNGRTTLQSSEIINSIDSINVSNLGSTVIVKVLISTLANQSIQVILPLDTSIGTA